MKVIVGKIYFEAKKLYILFQPFCFLKVWLYPTTMIIKGTMYLLT